MLRTALIGLAPLLLAPLAFADVLTVAPGGAHSDFAQIHAAAAAAADGDVILVAAGSYDPVTLPDTSLTIVADTGADVFVRERFTIKDLSAGRAVVVRGIDNQLVSGFGTSGHGLIIEDCAGAVFIEDGTFRGTNNSTSSYVGANVAFCEAVSFIGCTFVGGTGYFCSEDLCDFSTDAGDGGNGVFVRASNVAIEACSLTGGRGGEYDFAEPVDGEPGGHGLEVRGGSVHVAGSLLQGGQGGPLDCGFIGCGVDGPGGHGVLIGPGAIVTLRSCTIMGGESNDLFASPIDTEDDGVYLLSGTPARILTSNTPVREGETLELSFQGRPDDFAFLWLAAAPGWTRLLAYEGVLQLGLPLPLPGIPLATLPPSGVLDVPIPIGDLGGLEGFPLFLQMSVQSPIDGARLGSPTAVVLLADLF